MKIGDTTASYIQYLLDIVTSHGTPKEELLAAIGLNPKELEDGNNRVDLAYLMRLGYHAIKITKEPAVGLIAGKTSSITRFGLPGLGAMTSPNLGEALQVITHYEAIYGRCYRGASCITTTNNTPHVEFYSIAPYNDYTYFVVDAVLSGWSNAIEWLTGRTDLVASAHFEFPAPLYHEQYKKAFSCPVYFAQEKNELVLTEGALPALSLHSNPSLHEQLIIQCDQALTQVSQADSHKNKVLKVLGTMLHGKTPSIEDVAQQLGMPTWTLRRKLKDEDTSYQTLVDEMRKDVALSYMKNTELSFGEISYLLGFSTPGAFQRAFKRWSGITPGEYRKTLK